MSLLVAEEKDISCNGNLQVHELKSQVHTSKKIIIEHPSGRGQHVCPQVAVGEGMWKIQKCNVYTCTFQKFYVIHTCPCHTFASGCPSEILVYGDGGGEDG
jgi:hypothetical protein